MKVVKLENKKLTEEELRSNQNMHKPEDVHIHADIPYGVARDEDTAAQEHAEEVFDELEKNAEGITPKDPDDGGVKIEKNAYSEPIALDESLFTEDADDDNEIAKFLKDSVEWLIEEDEGCSTYKLDDRLGICVGWQDGYDPEDELAIHSATSPQYAIVAGIKVYTSDDMRTDYDWINYPYFANGEVMDDSVTIEPNENYDKLARYFSKEFDAMKDWEIEEDGLVIRSDDGEEDAVEESLDFEPMVSPDEWAAYKGVSVIDDNEIVGLDIFNVRDKLGRWYTLDSQSVGIAGGVYNFIRPGFGQFSKVTLVTDRNGVVNEVKGVVFSDEKSDESLSISKKLKEFFVPDNAKPYRVSKRGTEYYISQYDDLARKMMGNNTAYFDIAVRRPHWGKDEYDNAGLELKSEDQAKKTIDRWCDQEDADYDKKHQPGGEIESLSSGKKLKEDWDDLFRDESDKEQTLIEIGRNIMGGNTYGETGTGHSWSLDVDGDIDDYELEEIADAITGDYTNGMTSGGYSWSLDIDSYYGESKKLTEKKGKVEGEDDNVYQLVYDALFLGNKNFRPHIADEAGSVYDWEQSLIMLPGYNDYDLGIALEKEEDGKYAKAVADKLGLKYEIKPTSSLSDGYKFIATVRIPDEIANKDATEYVTSIGLDMDTIRPKRKGKK